MATTLPVDIELNYKLPLSWQYDKVEFLGLPHLKDNRPLKLGEIFIPLRFKLSPDDETTLFLPKLLKEHKHLVILGDPGCGKSTLVKQVTHSFSTSTPPSWTSHFGKLLPIPIILRDYRVGEWNNYEDMLRSFISKLDPSIRDLVTVEWLLGYLEKGEAIVLLDGIDEIGSAEARKRLRDKVILPMIEKLPNSYFILTSRIIGYDEARFSERVYDPTDIELSKTTDWSVPTILPHSRSRRLRHVVTPYPFPKQCFVAPFNDEDIEQFITRWYAARESNTELRREGVESLNRALAQNDRVRELASNPSLLTLIALIHRVTAHLPSGRIKLYEKITEAYLETIQNYRKLEQFPASLEQMKRWLARVGWEMQSHRTGRAQENKEVDLLATQRIVRSWLIEAIAEEQDNAEEEADKFLKYVTQRSGLLIPRGMDEEGNDLFSFVHLTFQEYFAALHLRSLAWDFSQVVEHCSAHLTHRYWHETILVLFEMLAEMRGSGDRLVKLLAEQAKEPEQQQAAAEIFSALLLDSESGLSPAAQEQAAFFALDVICEQSNGIVIRNLKALPQTNLKGWIAKPMLQQLREGNLFQLGSDFLLIGDDFFSDWPQVVKEIVTVRGNDSWPSEQVACATLIASRAKEIVEWAGSRMPLHFWLAPIRRFWGMCTATIEGREIMLSNLSLAELNFSLLINAQAFSIKHNLLAQAALSMAINGSQFLRSSVKARQFGLPLARQIDQSLARYFSQSLSQYLNTFLHRSLSQYVERSSDWYLTRYFDRALAINTGHYVDIYLGQLISTYQLIVNPKTTISSTDIKDIVTLSATAEWLSFQPDQESERLATIEALRKFLPATKDNDDWTRLLAINNLITLSAGTPELVAERNRLCDKAMTTPDEFTFPAELREATQDKEWFNLPEIIAIIFLHEPGDPFLKPEWFDPKNEESKFFLSPPREFFALAAEVLDPEGKTELAKWRNGKFQNKESSTA